MKINYKTHPILQSLHSNRDFEMPFFREDFIDFQNNSLILELFHNDLMTNLSNFRSKITHVSESFHSAYVNAQDKLFPLIKERVSAGCLAFEGTYIIGHFTHFIKCNYIDIAIDSPLNDMVHFVFLNTGQPVLYSSRVNEKLYKWVSKEVINGNIMGNKITSNDQVRQLARMALTEVTLVDIFKEHADVEVKSLQPNSKDNTIGCQYNNGTKSKIQFLDSKWFTTLVKSDAFKVRGHFRLQPYGEGLKQKKLIWINDFEKTGYTASAQKLNR